MEKKTLKMIYVNFRMCDMKITIRLLLMGLHGKKEITYIVSPVEAADIVTLNFAIRLAALDRIK